MWHCGNFVLWYVANYILRTAKVSSNAKPKLNDKINLVYTCTHVHMYTCTHVNMYTCTHVHMYNCTHVHMYTCTHEYKQVAIGHLFILHIDIIQCRPLCCVCMLQWILHYVHGNSFSCLNVTYIFLVFPRYVINEVGTKVYHPKLHLWGWISSGFWFGNNLSCLTSLSPLFWLGICLQ